MKSTWALLGIAILMVTGLAMKPATTCRGIAVSDSEASMLFGGGCVDGDQTAAQSMCGAGGGGNCAVTHGYTQFVAGSGVVTNVNCGAASCGNVDLTSCNCEN